MTFLKWMFQIHVSLNFLAFLDFSDFRNPVYRRTNFSGISMEKGGNEISPKVYFSTSFQRQLWPYLWLCPFQLRLKNGHDNMPHQQFALIITFCKFKKNAIHRRNSDPLKHLWWSFLGKIVNGLKPLTTFA